MTAGEGAATGGAGGGGGGDGGVGGVGGAASTVLKLGFIELTPLSSDCVASSGGEGELLPGELMASGVVGGVCGVVVVESGSSTITTAAEVVAVPL